MATRIAPGKPINIAEQKSRKATQLERLISGMIHAAACVGYAGATVSEVIARAGVSRPTFYDYFEDREACFLAATGHGYDVLVEEIGRALAESPPELAAETAIRTLIAFAAAEPVSARFLLAETLAASPRSLDARDEGVARIERLVEDAYGGLDRDVAMPDLSVRMMIGGVSRMLASKLRRGDPAISALAEDLLEWMRSYAMPLGEHRWRALAPGPALARSPYVPKVPLRAPLPLPPRRSRLSREEVAENHRQRILFATAEVAVEKGYTAATVADITRSARIDGRAFYAQFTDKQDAFMAIHELGFQQTMAVTAGAFFSASSWPERVWEGGKASAQFLQINPTIAHVGFVDAYAVGPGAVQRIEDSLTAFTIFLQEGYQHTTRKPPPSRLALEAIAATNLEMAYHQSRRSPPPNMAGLVPHITHLALAPFLGAAQTNRFIDERVQAAARRRERTSAATG